MDTKCLIFGGGDIAGAIHQKITSQVISHRECDVTDVYTMFDIVNVLKPETIINCAGVSFPTSIKESRFDEWYKEIQTNLIGSYNLAKIGSALGVKNFIFIASVAGLYGKPNHSGYSASKAGVISLVQSMGMEGYNAYAISPGRVDTKLRERDYPKERKATRLKPSEIATLIEDILASKYLPGDNIIIRRIGTKTQPIKIDRGEPWKKDLKVGEPPVV